MILISAARVVVAHNGVLLLAKSGYGVRQEYSA
jgi:hypothetical protein